MNSLFHKWQDIKIKQKLILLLLLIAIIPIVVTQFFVSGIFDSRMAESQQKQLESTKNYITSLLDQYKNKSLSYIKFLRTEQSLVDAAFIAALTLERSRLIDEIKKQIEILDINSLEVIDIAGKVMARAQSPELFGDDKSHKNIIKNALAGRITSSVEVDNGVYSINAACPLMIDDASNQVFTLYVDSDLSNRDDNIIAVIMTGIYLNNVLAEKLKELSGAEIMFVFNNKIAASTLTHDNADEALRTISDPEKSVMENMEIEIRGTPYNIASVPLGDPDEPVSGELFILLSGKGIKNAQDNMRMLLIIVTLIALAFAVSIGYIISGNISRRISEGAAFAHRVAKGDLKEQKEVTSNDEIGMLGKSLKEMADDLRQMVINIKTSAANITEATRHIDMEKLADGSETQARSIEVFAAACKKINSSITIVADGAEGLSQSASESSSSIFEMTASIEEVARGADTLSTTVQDASSSVEEMTASIKQVSKNLDVLSAASEDTSATIDEFSASLKSVVINAHESALLSEQVKTDASELGIKAIEKTVEGMSRIIRSAEDASAVINRLGEMSSQIGNILKVINDVADETNLLSLNAAIIAAKSGEHGRSFAVVADAVKDLAQKTSYSTKEIASVIEAVQNEVKEAISTIKEVSDNAGDGMKLTKDAGNVLNTIVESSSRSSQMAWEIEKATNEQASGVVQINASIEKSTEMIRQIAHATKEIEKGTAQIIIAIEEVKSTSQHVRKATSEQIMGSKQITYVVEEVHRMAQSIAEATNDQKRESEEGVKEMEHIKEITRQNLLLAAQVKNAIETLTKQAELLQTEVKRFTL